MTRHQPALLFLLCALLSGCVKNTNFRDPHQRIVRDSAHTLTQWEVQPEVGLAGSGSGDLGVYLGAKLGLTDSTQLALNLAHVAVGWFSGALKQNIVDHERWALAAGAGLGWVNFNWMWVLPGNVQAELTSVDMFIIPLTVTGTFHATDWLDLSLALTYTHTEVDGDLDIDSQGLVASGSVGIREINSTPTIRVYPWSRMAISLSSKLPIWAAAPVAASAEAVVAPGVIAGGQSSSWQQLDFGRTWTIRASVEWPMTVHGHISLGIVHGVLSRNVLEIPVMPTFNLYWRFW